MFMPVMLVQLNENLNYKNHSLQISSIAGAFKGEHKNNYCEE
jgi:hypothetical protein